MSYFAENQLTKSLQIERCEKIKSCFVGLLIVRFCRAVSSSHRRKSTEIEVEVRPVSVA